MQVNGVAKFSSAGIVLEFESKVLGMVPIGVATLAAGNGIATVRVRLDGIATVDAPKSDAAAIGEIPRVANHPGPGTEEIGVEGDDDVGLAEVIDGVARRARCLTEAKTSAVGRDRVRDRERDLRVGLDVLELAAEQGGRRQVDLVAVPERDERVGDGPAAAGQCAGGAT